MNLQENIHRIKQMIGVINENDDKRIELGVKFLKDGYYYKTQKAIENTKSNDVYYLYQGKILIKYDKKIKLAKVNEVIWNELENYLGVNLKQIQEILKIWLEYYFDLEIGEINRHIAIVKYR
jgi:hypothetical protein